MPDFSMPAAVSSMVTGMTAAVISAARILPSKRNRTAITSKAPSARFFATVFTVASTSDAAIKHRLRFDAGWQRAVDGAKPFLDGSRHCAAVTANEHKRGADDDLLTVLAGAAHPWRTPRFDAGNIA